MKINKIVIIGIIFIISSFLVYFFDVLALIIRPITYLFLLGSSKGKDILFLLLIGIFLIFSQVIGKIKKNNKFLLIAIVLSSITLIFGIILEVLLRYQMNLSLNTIFVSMNPTMTSTSILHSHIFKSVFGNILTTHLNFLIPNGIHTGSSLYPYINPIANIIIFLIPIIFFILLLSISKRSSAITILLSFFSACLLIGIIDGGLFSTPAIIGIIGLIIIYRNEYYFNYYIGKLLKNDKIFKSAKESIPKYKINKKKYNNYKKFVFNRILPYLILFFIISLRFTIAFIGSNSEYYEIEIYNPKDFELNNLTIIENISFNNKTILHVYPELNENEMVVYLKESLKEKCEYYTVSWDIYTYSD